MHWPIEGSSDLPPVHHEVKVEPPELDESPISNENTLLPVDNEAGNEADDEEGVPGYDSGINEALHMSTKRVDEYGWEYSDDEKFITTEENRSSDTRPYEDDELLGAVGGSDVVNTDVPNPPDVFDANVPNPVAGPSNVANSDVDVALQFYIQCVLL